MLHELAPVFSDREISALLGRSSVAVNMRIHALGIQRPVSFYIERNRFRPLYPPELREVIALQNKVKRKLNDAENNCRSQRETVRAARRAK
ncbi:hypothetical protein WDL1CHR_02063 [Variovorax sp. WDL1]|nr:hypothetical protein CHC06_04502 [Variovorax sp. B2]PNG53729.1 hypothetical protein CHC07_03549 [Variovorax sp. B4]VTV11179.1 hypothetical protein WDL1CHR_02063 [Variovorax sp. WDL1]